MSPATQHAHCCLQFVPGAGAETHYDHVLADFGPEPYLGGLMAPTFYFPPESSNCHRINLQHHAKKPDVNFSTSTEALYPYIMIVDENPNCNVVQQARVAQDAGAAGLLIRSQYCWEGDEDTCGQKRAPPPTLPSDGSAQSINIPTMLVSNQTGGTIVDALKSNSTRVLTEFRTEFQPAAKRELNVTYWMNPADPVAVDLWTELNKVIPPLGQRLRIRPWLFTMTEHQDYYNNATSDKLCKYGYCAASVKNVTGAMVVEESLRRLCMAGKGNQMVDYMVYFHEHFNGKNFDHDKMIQAAYEAGKVDKEKVEKCMEDEHKRLLKSALVLQEELGVIRSPAAALNNDVLSVTPYAGTLFQFVCGEMEYAHKHCGTCGQCPWNAALCYEYGSCAKAHEHRHDKKKKDKGDSSKTHHRHPFLHFLQWTFIFGVVGGIGYAAYSQRNRNQVRRMLSDYVPMSMEDPTGTQLSEPSLAPYFEAPNQG